MAQKNSHQYTFASFVFQNKKTPLKAQKCQSNKLLYTFVRHSENNLFMHWNLYFIIQMNRTCL